MDAVSGIAFFVVLAAVWVWLVTALDDPRPGTLDWRVHRPFFNHR
jgi:hypothetical protein